MPRFHLQVTFPHLKVKDAVQDVTVEAGTPPTAAARGLRDILKRPGVKGKHHQSMKLTMIRVEETAVSELGE
jgi:hypothetical protein